MKKIVFAAAAALICTAASTAFAADADIVKFTHQNIVGSQTCYSGDDLLEKEITDIPDVYFGMRINKPVFRVYLKSADASAGTKTIKTEQYSKKGKLLAAFEKTVDFSSNNEQVVEFDHVRNTEYIKVYEDGEYIGGIGDDGTGSELVLTEFPDDYEIYQRGSDNTANIEFAGKLSIPPSARQVEVSEDGTVYAGVDDCTLYAATYSDDILTGLEIVSLQNGTSKLENPSLGMKLMFLDENMTPLINAWELESFYNNTSKVTLTVNEQSYESSADANGNFSFDIKLESGIYDAVLSYGNIEYEFKNFGVGDIWVAAGQSNMTDMGALTSGYDYQTEDPIPDDVHIIYPEDVTWQQMTHPAGEGRFFKSGIRTSPVTSFARELNEQLGVPIGIVQSSVGGTNIFQWAEGIKPDDDNDGYLGNAMKACFDNKSSKDITGIIWYQGCNDAINENYAYNYESLCETIFGQMRDFFGEDVPIITTQINDANQDSTAQLGYYDAWSYVKDVQRLYPETHDNVYVTGTGAYDLGDTIHNSAKSNLSVGGAWAKMALNKVYGMTDIQCEHPTIDTADITGSNEITLTFKNVGSEGLYLRTDNKYLAITNGMVTIPLGDLKKEFTVRMGGEKHLTASNKDKGIETEIISAELVDGNKVILTTADELNGNIAVDCCYGKRFVPTLTDKASGWSVLSFYNVQAKYPESIEPSAPVEYTATDTAFISQNNDISSDSSMYLNGYKGETAYAVMKFDISNNEKDKEHIVSADLAVFTSAVAKDRTGNINIDEIGTAWDNTAHYSSFTYSPIRNILSLETNTASIFPTGNYSDIDITDFIKNSENDQFAIGMSCDYAATCDMMGVNSDNPPKIIIQYGSIADIYVTDANGAPASNTEIFIQGKRSTQFEKSSYMTDENGHISVVLPEGEYEFSVENGIYLAYSEEFTVGQDDIHKTIKLALNESTPSTVVISGGETEVRETQATKTLEPFTAEAFDENGDPVPGVNWNWSIAPEIMAVVDNGIVTINSHATAGSVLTLTAQAEKNGITVSSDIQITITEAGDIIYDFDKFEYSKIFNTADSDTVKIGDDGLTGKVVSSGNYSNISVISSDDKYDTSSYFPYGAGLPTTGYYLFLGAGGNNGSPVFTINLSEPASSGKYLNIKFAKPYCTNNGTANRTASAPDSIKTITIGSTVIDVQAECDYDKWYTKSIQLDSGIDKISVQLGKWAGLAIEYISVTDEPVTDEIIIPEGTESIKMMCLGDSITEGFTVNGAYRNRLCSLIEADGISEVVDFIGDRSNGSGYDKDHAGHSGYAIADIPAADDCEGKGRNGITDELDSYIKTNTPDIVLLMIGTNDVLSLYKLDESKSRLETLVLAVEERLSDGGMIYLATIPYIAEDAKYNNTGKTQDELNTIIDNFNNGVREIADAYENIELVDINSLMSLSDLQDGIHPNAAGYNKMGDYWYSAIEEHLKNLILQ